MVAKLILFPRKTGPLIRGSDLLLQERPKTRRRKPRGYVMAVRCRQTVKPFWYGEHYAATVVDGDEWPKGQLLLLDPDGKPVMADADDFEPVNARHRKFFPYMRLAKPARRLPKGIRPVGVDEFGVETPLDLGEVA